MTVTANGGGYQGSVSVTGDNTNYVDPIAATQAAILDAVDGSNANGDDGVSVALTKADVLMRISESSAGIIIRFNISHDTTEQYEAYSATGNAAPSTFLVITEDSDLSTLVNGRLTAIEEHIDSL